MRMRQQLQPAGAGRAYIRGLEKEATESTKFSAEDKKVGGRTLSTHSIYRQMRTAAAHCGGTGRYKDTIDRILTTATTKNRPRIGQNQLGIAHEALSL